MSRVLVTGATGGLGLAVAEALAAEGFDVRATGRNRSVAGRLQALRGEFVAADLNDPTALPGLVKDIDGIIHCAALSSPWGRYDDFYRINVVATRALLAAARSAGVRRFVFVSSPSVYARPIDQEDLRESDAPNPRPMNAYAATKGMAEREVLAQAGQGMACVAIRPRAIIGPDDTVVLPRVLRLVGRGRFPLLRGGQGLIEPTDSRDAASALMAALKRAEAVDGEVFNISGGRCMTIKAMVERLASELEVRLKFIPLPYRAVAVAASAMEAVCTVLPGQPEPPVTPYTLTTLAFSQTFNLTKARAGLDYQPRFDAFETALRVARERRHAG